MNIVFFGTFLIWPKIHIRIKYLTCDLVFIGSFRCLKIFGRRILAEWFRKIDNNLDVTIVVLIFGDVGDVFRSRWYWAFSYQCGLSIGCGGSFTIERSTISHGHLLRWKFFVTVESCFLVFANSWHCWYHRPDSDNIWFWWWTLFSWCYNINITTLRWHLDLFNIKTFPDSYGCDDLRLQRSMLFGCLQLFRGS